MANQSSPFAIILSQASTAKQTHIPNVIAFSVRKLHKCKLNVHEIAKRICTLRIIRFSHSENKWICYIWIELWARIASRRWRSREKSELNAGEKRSIMWENGQRPSGRIIASKALCLLFYRTRKLLLCWGVIYCCIIRALSHFPPPSTPAESHQTFRRFEVHRRFKLAVIKTGGERDERTRRMTFTLLWLHQQITSADLNVFKLAHRRTGL